MSTFDAAVRAAGEEAQPVNRKVTKIAEHMNADRNTAYFSSSAALLASEVT